MTRSGFQKVSPDIRFSRFLMQKRQNPFDSVHFYQGNGGIRFAESSFVPKNRSAFRQPPVRIHKRPKPFDKRREATFFSEKKEATGFGDSGKLGYLCRVEFRVRQNHHLFSMKGDFFAATIRITPNEEWLRDLVADALGAIGYEAFEETEQGLVACIDADLFDEEALRETLSEMKEYGSLSYRTEVVKARNWNERWEQEGRKPVTVDNLYIHPSTQPRSTLPYDIIIDPRQSFGTGTHVTTQMMLRYVQNAEMKGRSLLDVGTGTGVIAILAKQAGAEEVVGVEIEEGAVENAHDNCKLNDVEVELHLGSIEQVTGREFDYVIANINRNILMGMMTELRQAVKAPNGRLLLSGFLLQDKEVMTAAAQEVGLKVCETFEADEWLMMVFEIER